MGQAKTQCRPIDCREELLETKKDTKNGLEASEQFVMPQHSVYLLLHTVQRTFSGL